jgi:hypothetical protein
MSADQKQKEPILTALLNFFTGGGGYIYIGQTAKGAVFIAGAVVTILMVCLLMGGTAALGWAYTLQGACGTFFPIPFWWLIALAAAWDGYKLTQRINTGHELGKWEFTISRK